MSSSPRPNSVKIVAGLFLGAGVFHLVASFGTLIRGVVEINLLIPVLLVVGWGLLRKRGDGWRKGALAVAAFYVAAASILLAASGWRLANGVPSGSTFSMTVLGDPVSASVASSVGLPVAIGAALAAAAIGAYVIRVLTSAAAKRSFAA